MHIALLKNYANASLIAILILSSILVYFSSYFVNNLQTMIIMKFNAAIIISQIIYINYNNCLDELSDSITIYFPSSSI